MYAEKFKNQNSETTMAYIKGKNVILDTYNLKGKRIFHFEDKVKSGKNEWADVSNVYEKGKYIYYLYSKVDTDMWKKDIYLNRVNKKTGKLMYSKRIYKDVEHTKICDIKFINGKVYLLQEDKIVSHSLKGKKLCEYSLPEGKTFFSDTFNGYSIVPRLTFKKYDVYGDYIYFCNANGVYRCSITDNDGFSLFYDASTDEYFSDKYGLVDMKVTNDNMFYLLLMDEAFVDAGIPTKQVKYTGEQR